MTKRSSRWTATSILALAPRSSPYTDPSTPGNQIFVRARQDGSVRRSWLLHAKFRGVELRLAIGTHPETSLEAARVEVRRLRELAGKGIDPRTARRRRSPRPAPLPGGAAVTDQHSIDFLASEFIERHIKPNHKRPEYTQAILAKHVLPEWAGRDARTIKPREVIELLDKVVASGHRVMANKVAALLAQLFRYGIHRALVDDSPVKLLMRPGGKQKPRQRALTDAELAAYLADPLKCTRQARLSHVIAVLLATAARRGELTLARWRDVDLKARTWRIPAENAKTGVECLVPLTDMAVEAFTKLANAAGKSPWVLPGKNPAQPLEPRLLTRGVAKCLARFKKQGIAEFTLHDLRRTTRTGLARLKVQPHVAERCLNHAQEKIPGTYDTHDYLDEKRAALELWAAHLVELTRASPQVIHRKQRPG
jgi:integrase